MLTTKKMFLIFFFIISSQSFAAANCNAVIFSSQNKFNQKSYTLVRNKIEEALSVKARNNFNFLAIEDSMRDRSNTDFWTIKSYLNKSLHNNPMSAEELEQVSTVLEQNSALARILYSARYSVEFDAQCARYENKGNFMTGYHLECVKATLTLTAYDSLTEKMYTASGHTENELTENSNAEWLYGKSSTAFYNLVHKLVQKLPTCK